jgi:acyl carrier protein
MDRADMLMKIKEGIQDVFPEALNLELSEAMVLESIPGWDSMAAVNLQIYLENAFGVAVPGEMLTGDTRIEDILEHIQGG